MKIKVVYSFEIEVEPDWYPKDINTIDEICVFERSNEAFGEVIINKIEEDAGKIEIFPA